MTTSRKTATAADTTTEPTVDVEPTSGIEPAGPIVDASAAEPTVAELVDAELQTARLALLKAFNAAVSPTNGGLDIVLGRQVAEVYHFLFGEKTR